MGAESLCDPDPCPRPPVMIAVPAGTFTMGDDSSACGVNEREVTLTNGFHMGRTEVTNLEYLQALQWAYNHGHVTAVTHGVFDNLDDSRVRLLIMSLDYCEIQFDGAGRFYLRQSPSSLAHAAYPSGYDPSDHPVKGVTWHGAARYCDWLSMMAGLPRTYEHSGDWACNSGYPYIAPGYRLPTDAEWEYAVPWNDGRVYAWGSEQPDCSLANYRRSLNFYCVRWTTPVGSLPAGASQLGLLDMAGNVWEWCNDWFQCELGVDPVVDPAGPGTGESRVIRGGSWFYSGTGGVHLRGASRDGHEPGIMIEFRGGHGFRIARSGSP